MGYFGSIHKITGIDKRTEWKLYLVSFLNQIHLKIGQEAKKNYEFWKITSALTHHELSSENNGHPNIMEVSLMIVIPIKICVVIYLPWWWYILWHNFNYCNVMP